MGRENDKTKFRTIPQSPHLSNLHIQEIPRKFMTDKKNTGLRKNYFQLKMSVIILIFTDNEHFVYLLTILLSYYHSFS